MFVSGVIFIWKKLWISAHRPHRRRSALGFSSGFTKIQIAYRLIACTEFWCLNRCRWKGPGAGDGAVCREMTVLWLTWAVGSCLLIKAASTRLSAGDNRHQCTQLDVFPPDETSARRVVVGGVIRFSGLIDTPGFNSHRQCWSSHQRSISAKLQLSHSEPKKSVNNLPVLTVNVLMCMLQSDVEIFLEMFRNSFL